MPGIHMSPIRLPFPLQRCITQHTQHTTSKIPCMRCIAWRHWCTVQCRLTTYRQCIECIVYKQSMSEWVSEWEYTIGTHHIQRLDIGLSRVVPQHALLDAPRVPREQRVLTQRHPVLQWQWKQERLFLTGALVSEGVREWVVLCIMQRQ
jgi:hypothetical protein